jgi:methyl-accepting chemotaxis protein
MLSDKRRLLRDEEAKLHEVERKIRDKQFNERTIAERLKNEYDDLRHRFEQMAFELRFSIEDELKIYARLLDELMKKSSVTSTSTATTQQFGGATQQSGTTTSTTISSVIRSSGIEDQGSSYQQAHTTSSSAAPGNVTFDLGSSNSPWSNSGATANESLFRTGDYETSSMTRTSSSHLN